jgi:DNA-nicking Smr family endonuclease
VKHAWPRRRPAPTPPATPEQDVPAPDDRDAFLKAVADAAPLRPLDRVVHPPPEVPPVPVQTLLDEHEALADTLSGDIPYELHLETGEALVFTRDGIGRDVLRKLRRGHWVVQSQLDLHGLRSDEARLALGLFLADCRGAGLRCVRIVHGKGLRSRNREPVLKGKVARWLASRDEVLAYCEARPADGGGGALVVLLRSPLRSSRPSGSG